MQVADLGSVQKTLLLPLWGRAVEAQKQNPMLVELSSARVSAVAFYLHLFLTPIGSNV